MSAKPCTRPPEGWWCSLEEGHDGPCPTHPYYGTPLEVALAPYLSPEAIASVRAELEAHITPGMAERQEAALARFGAGRIKDSRNPAFSNTPHVCEECPTCGVHEGRHDKCCGCYDGVCCQESTKPTVQYGSGA